MLSIKTKGPAASKQTYITTPNPSRVAHLGSSKAVYDSYFPVRRQQEGRHVADRVPGTNHLLSFGARHYGCAGFEV